MLPDPASLRQVEGQKGPAPPRSPEALDATGRRRPQHDSEIEEHRDQLGIEDADPRWSRRELVLRRLDVPGAPGPEPHLAGDASDFRGQPGDPFETLIKRREERRRRSRREREGQVRLQTGLATLDQATDGLEPALYALSGPADLCRTLAHQIACQVARDFPVVYLSYGHPARELTLQALARLAGGRAPGDLARARDLAGAFRPVRDNLLVVPGTAEESVGRLRARLLQAMARKQARHGLLVIDDLYALALPAAPGAGRAQTTPAQGTRAAEPGRGARPGQAAVPDPAAGPGTYRAPPGWVPGKAGPSRSQGRQPDEASATVPQARPPGPPAEVLACAEALADLAERLGVPVLAVSAGGLRGDPERPWPASGAGPGAGAGHAIAPSPEPVRLLLGEAPRGGGPVELTVQRPQLRRKRPKAVPAPPPVVGLTWEPRRWAFEPRSDTAPPAE